MNKVGALKKKIKAFLKKQKFLPINKNNKKYGYVLSFKLKKLKDYNRISVPNFRDKRIKGIYIYKCADKYIYIGKGNPILGRLRAHYKASFGKINNDKFCEFWARYKDKELDIYYQKEDTEAGRKTLEMMLIYALNIEFEKFNEKWKEGALKVKYA